MKLKLTHYIPYTSSKLPTKNLLLICDKCKKRMFGYRAIVEVGEIEDSIYCMACAEWSPSSPVASTPQGHFPD